MKISFQDPNQNAYSLAMLFYAIIFHLLLYKQWHLQLKETKKCYDTLHILYGAPRKMDNVFLCLMV